MQCGPAPTLRSRLSRFDNFFELQFIEDLLNPFVDAFVRQFWLAIFINRQARKWLSSARPFEASKW